MIFSLKTVPSTAEAYWRHISRRVYENAQHMRNSVIGYFSVPHMQTGILQSPNEKAPEPSLDQVPHEESNVITLTSGTASFEVEKKYALISGHIQHILDGEPAAVNINVNIEFVPPHILANIVEYMKECKGDNSRVEAHERTFDLTRLCGFRAIQLAQASNYLQMKNLLDVSCKKLVSVLQDKHLYSEESEAMSKVCSLMKNLQV
jgi:hypothetical protein